MEYYTSMYKLNSETRKDLDSAMSFCENKKAFFSRDRDERKNGRGNPLLSRKRFTTIEEIDSRLENLFGKSGK